MICVISRFITPQAQGILDDALTEAGIRREAVKFLRLGERIPASVKVVVDTSTASHLLGLTTSVH